MTDFCLAFLSFFGSTNNMLKLTYQIASLTRSNFVDRNSFIIGHLCVTMRLFQQGLERVVSS